MNTDVVIVPAQNLDSILAAIQNAREDISRHFLTLGQILTEVKTQRLYREGGHKNFSSFLKDPRVDLSLQDADRFMAITANPEFARQAALGLSKVLELLKLPTEQRALLMEKGATVKGEHKALAEMSVSDVKAVSQDLKRQGKTRCDRCNRWVEHTKDLDGRNYGAGEDHSCYELELEERRSLTAGRYEEPKVEALLNTLRPETVPSEAEPASWLPDSLYQLYGQMLQEQSSGEVSREQLEQEGETLKKLIRLCQGRLREIKDTQKMLDELEASA